MNLPAPTAVLPGANGRLILDLAARENEPVVRSQGYRGEDALVDLSTGTFPHPGAWPFGAGVQLVGGLFLPLAARGARLARLAVIGRRFSHLPAIFSRI